MIIRRLEPGEAEVTGHDLVIYLKDWELSEIDSVLTDEATDISPFLQQLDFACYANAIGDENLQ